PGMSILGFRCLKELLVGKDPLSDPQELWDKLYIGTSYFGRRGVALHCISAIDNCLWSIRAQAANLSLGELLRQQWVAVGREANHGLPGLPFGHPQPPDRSPPATPITAYASTLFCETPDAMYAAARGYVERGFRAVKFGWGVFGEDPK